MKIYRAVSFERREIIHPVDDADWENFTVRLNGRPQKENWTPIPVRIVKEEYDGTKWMPATSPWLGSHALVFKEDAAIKLGAFLTDAGELLPLECADEPLYVWQPLCIVDALDIDSSDVSRFSDGRLMRIRRHAFRSEMLDGVVAFKIPNLRSSCIYLSERAVQVMSPVVSDGLGFEVIWDSEKKKPNQAPEPMPLKRHGLS